MSFGFQKIGLDKALDIKRARDREKADIAWQQKSRDRQKQMWKRDDELFPLRKEGLERQNELGKINLTQAQAEEAMRRRYEQLRKSGGLAAMQKMAQDLQTKGSFDPKDAQKIMRVTKNDSSINYVGDGSDLKFVSGDAEKVFNKIPQDPGQFLEYISAQYVNPELGMQELQRQVTEWNTPAEYVIKGKNGEQQIVEMTPSQAKKMRENGQFARKKSTVLAQQKLRAGGLGIEKTEVDLETARRELNTPERSYTVEGVPLEVFKEFPKEKKLQVLDIPPEGSDKTILENIEKGAKNNNQMANNLRSDISMTVSRLLSSEMSSVMAQMSGIDPDRYEKMSEEQKKDYTTSWASNMDTARLDAIENRMKNASPQTKQLFASLKQKLKNFEQARKKAAMFQRTWNELVTNSYGLPMNSKEKSNPQGGSGQDTPGRKVYNPNTGTIEAQ